MKLNCNLTQQCLSKSVQYQCAVTESDTLFWKIINNNMTSLGTKAYTTGGDLVTAPAPFPNSLPFFTDYTSKSPSLISNISFTVQSSINGYIIHCGDIHGNMANCTIDTAGDMIYYCTSGNLPSCTKHLLSLHNNYTYNYN